MARRRSRPGRSPSATSSPPSRARAEAISLKTACVQYALGALLFTLLIALSRPLAALLRDALPRRHPASGISILSPRSYESPKPWTAYLPSPIVLIVPPLVLGLVAAAAEHIRPGSASRAGRVLLPLATRTARAAYAILTAWEVVLWSVDQYIPGGSECIAGGIARVPDAPDLRVAVWVAAAGWQLTLELRHKWLGAGMGGRGLGSIGAGRRKPIGAGRLEMAQAVVMEIEGS